MISDDFQHQTIEYIMSIATIFTKKKKKHKKHSKRFLKAIIEKQRKFYVIFGEFDQNFHRFGPTPIR